MEDARQHTARVAGAAVMSYFNFLEYDEDNDEERREATITIELEARSL